MPRNVANEWTMAVTKRKVLRNPIYQQISLTSKNKILMYFLHLNFLSLLLDLSCGGNLYLFEYLCLCSYCAVELIRKAQYFKYAVLLFSINHMQWCIHVTLIQGVICMIHSVVPSL